MYSVAIRHNERRSELPPRVLVSSSQFLQDLDGDMYFVSWDERLLPPNPTEPLARPKPRKKVLNLRDETMVHEAAKTFAALYRKRLLGTMSNKWTEVVEESSRLANHPYALALVPLIEAALVRSRTPLVTVSSCLCTRIWLKQATT